MSKDLNTQPAEEQQIDLETMSLDEFEQRLHSDEQFQKEYLDKPDDPKYKRLNEAFAKKQLNMPDGEVNKQSESSNENLSGAQSTEVTVDMLDVAAQIPKDLFGTYITNRSPAEAVIEALKGNKEKDRYIESLRGKLNETQGETQTLRAQLTAALERAKSPQGNVQSAANGDGVDVTDFDVEDVDLFVPEDQEKVKNVIRGLVKKVGELSSGKAQPAQQGQQNPGDVDVYQKQYQEIADFQAVVPELQTSEPFVDLDKKMRGFYDSIKQLSGGDEATAWNLYNEQTPQGEQFRQKCSQYNIVLPDEHDKHTAIMQIRAERDREVSQQAQHMTSMLRAQGKLGDNEEFNPDMLPPSSRSYFAYWQKRQQTSQPQEYLTRQPSMQPPVINPALQQQIDARRENPKPQTPTTVPHEMIKAPLQDPMQMPIDDFNRIHEKFQNNPSTLTSEEAQLYAKIHEANNVALPHQLKQIINSLV
jgi:hypothetical protein